MTARLPIPGGDDDIWGEILNDFLDIEHRPDGTLKIRTDGTFYSMPSGGIDSTDMSSAVQHSLNAAANAVQLGGDLGGTTANPTVTKLNGIAISGSPTANQVLSASNGESAAWTTLGVSNTFNPIDYGARLDAARADTVTCSTMSPAITAAGSNFSPADVGKLAVVYNDTQVGIFTTIASVQSATRLTLTSNAGLTLSGSAVDHLIYGTDDSSAIQAALNLAAAEQNVTLANGANTPLGLGNPVVDIPAINQGGAIIANALTVPSGVDFNCNSMLFNFLHDRTIPCVTASYYTVVGRILVDCLQGTGIMSAGGTGSGTGTQAHNRWNDVRLWHVGTTAGTDNSQYAGMTLTGYHHEIDSIWIKGGNIGLYHNPGHDTVVKHAYFVGCNTAVSMNSTDNCYYGFMKLDSCGTGPGAPGIDIYNRCSWLRMNISAFSQVATNIVSPVVQIGKTVAGTNKDLFIEVQADNTGGSVLSVAFTADSHIKVIASNVQDNSINVPITTAVVFGAAATSGGSGSLQVEATVGTGITPYSGTVLGEFSYLQGGIRTIVTNSKLSTNALQITGGSPSSGAVLTADTAGNATWQQSTTSPALATSGQGYLYGPGVSPWATTSTATMAGNSTANVMKVTQFTCPVSITITHVSVYVVTGVASTTANVAIYNAVGTTKLLDTSFSTTSIGVVTAALSSPVTLQAGAVYWLATASANTSVSIAGIGMSANFEALFTAGMAIRVGYSSTTLSGTTMPGSIGILTASDFSIGCPLFEP